MQFLKFLVRACARNSTYLWEDKIYDENKAVKSYGSLPRCAYGI